MSNLTEKLFIRFRRPKLTENFFISYRRAKSADSARAIREELTRRRHEVFQDTELEKPGKFWESITKNLMNSSVVLVLVEKGCWDGIEKSDDYFAQEINIALSLEKVVIPIFIGRDAPISGDLPALARRLLDHQAADWKDNISAEMLAEKLERMAMELHKPSFIQIRKTRARSFIAIGLSCAALISLIAILYVLKTDVVIRFWTPPFKVVSVESYNSDDPEVDHFCSKKYPIPRYECFDQVIDNVSKITVLEYSEFFSEELSKNHKVSESRSSLRLNSRKKLHREIMKIAGGFTILPVNFGAYKLGNHVHLDKGIVYEVAVEGCRNTEVDGLQTLIKEELEDSEGFGEASAYLVVKQHPICFFSGIVLKSLDQIKHLLSSN